MVYKCYWSTQITQQDTKHQKYFVVVVVVVGVDDDDDDVFICEGGRYKEGKW
jgi:hypothetical protein